MRRWSLAWLALALACSLSMGAEAAQRGSKRPGAHAAAPARAALASPAAKPARQVALRRPGLIRVGFAPPRGRGTGFVLPRERHAPAPARMSWTQGLPPAAGIQANECPDGTMATLARGHEDIVRCMPI